MTERIGLKAALIIVTIISKLDILLQAYYYFVNDAFLSGIFCSKRVRLETQMTERIGLKAALIIVTIISKLDILLQAYYYFVNDAFLSGIFCSKRVRL